MNRTITRATSRRVPRALACACLLALFTLAPSQSASAQPAACNKSCAWWDAPCKEREANCTTKLGLYYTYMSGVGAGAAYAPLPPLYVNLLRPRYPGVDLNDVRVAFSPRQLSVAITDCKLIYFNDQTYFNRVRAGTLAKGADDLRLLYHELAHAEQCAQVGGRDAYAAMWWQDLDTAFARNPDPRTLHDRQPMEAAAIQKASAVDAALPEGLVLPLALTGLTSDVASPGPVNYDVNWTATAEGGGSVAFAFDAVSILTGATVGQQGFGPANVFRWRPPAEGRYRVRVRAQRPGSPVRTLTARYEARGAGGPGGGPFASACPAGSVLTGFNLRVGWHVDSLQPICTQVTADGRWKFVRFSVPGGALFAESLGLRVGGDGGGPVTLRCDRDWGVESLIGRSGWVVHSLGIRCGRLGRTALWGSNVGIVGTERRDYGPVGAGGGDGSWYELGCFSGAAVTAVSGRSGSLVDQINRTCGLVTPTQ